MKHFYKIIAFILFVFPVFSGYAQITVTDSSTAEELASYLTGDGVIILNPEINSTCALTARGKFNYNGNTSDIGIDSGIVLTCGRVETILATSPFQTGINAAYENFANNSFSGAGDADLTTISGSPTNDACVLEFDFVPAGDSIKFQYVFASEEYHCPNCSVSGSGTDPFGWNFNCSFNDVFGFFISGPGFTGLNNIALVPGTTNVAVGVSTVNDGTQGCSTYTQYYNDNVGNLNFVYTGFTDVFTAQAAVSPCDTYHLKLAIADAIDESYDSGVFLKSGSLTSTSISVKTFGGGGLETPFTNTVRGCPPGVVRISRNGGLNQPVTIPLQYSGTAVNGTDYQALPSSVTIPAGDSVATLYVRGIPLNPPVGPKSCVIAAMSPYTCSNGTPIVVSSDTIMIYDSIYVKILNPDTAICTGESVHILTEGDSILSYNWTPSSTVDNPVARNVTVTPDGPTTYTVSVNLPLSTGCPPSTDHIFIDVKKTPQVSLGADIFTCFDSIQLNAQTSPLNPDETFSWSPGTGLSDSTIRNPVVTLNGNAQYVVTVNPGAVGCDGTDTINITLLPDHINVLNEDTAVCAGTVISLRTDGDDHFSYNWSPEQDIANDTLKNTTLSAHQSGYYTLTASYPGCLPMPDSFYVEVQPVPEVQLGPDRIICTYDTIQLYASVSPPYNNYTYRWMPNEDLTDTTIKNPVFSGDNSRLQIVKVSTPLGCSGGDTMSITVNPGDFLTVLPTDTGACPPAAVQLHASGAAVYSWSPADGLDDPSAPDPMARPETTTQYTVIGTSNLHCLDTATILFEVYPGAVINLPDSVQIWPGESYRMNPGGNALYYAWFPPSGLSAADISNPVASPEVRTRYFVTATTENGCVVKDSIDVLVNTETAIDAPNAFTPGHGPNGDFKVVKRGIATLKYFRVYNRWGNKIFETSDINKGWDGTYNGVPQPMGVYVYSIEAVTATGRTFHKDGNVTLIR